MYTNASENGTPDHYRTTHHYLFVQLYGWHHWPSLSRRWLIVGHQTDADQRRCHMPDARAVGFVYLGVSARAENRRDRAFHICIILWCRRRVDNLSTAIRIFDRYGGAAPWPAKVQLCNEFCQHQLRRGEAVAIVLKRHGLSAACDDRNTDVIISLATPLYPCRTAKPIYYFTQNMDDNYLLYIDKTGVNCVSSNSGSGQLACLALQPRQC